MGCQEGGANSLQGREKSTKAARMANDAAGPLQTSAAPAAITVAGTRLQLIESGEARLRALLDLIASARESVRMQFYMFNPDWAGRLVREALVEAAKRGVEVKLLIDGFGSVAQPKVFTRLDEAGGEP